MKTKKLFRVIAFFMCMAVLKSTVAIASEHMVELSYKENSVQSVSVDSASTQAKKINEKYKVMFLFIFTRSEPSLFNGINGALLIGQEVKVKSNNGIYCLVETEDKREVYVFGGALGTGISFRKSLTLPSYAHAYTGNTSSTKVIAKYDGTNSIQWSVSDSSVISFDEETGTIKGLKPGVATITAKAGLFDSDECVVSVINRWYETETADAEKKIEVKVAPGASYDTRGVVDKGKSIVARGDMADGNGWIYVSALDGAFWGFIKLSDFPKIDYLMTEYHYYDEGYEERFGSASTKIYDYASVLNNVMMANFKLKVCPYVESYTSSADQCKIWRYGSVYSGNLSSSCPKNGNHKADSCLQTGYLRDDLKKRFENGGGTVSKVAWTGHIMNNYEIDRSNATIGMGTIIITPYATTNPNNNFSNYSSTKIRRELLYTLVHETGHQLSLHDHYCKKDFSEQTGKCSNEFCVTCNKLPYSDDCIMLDRIDIETLATNKIYCDYCKSTIKNYLSDNF